MSAPDTLTPLEGELVGCFDPETLDFAADSFDRLQAAPRIAERLRNMAANQRSALAKARVQSPEVE